MVDEQPAALLDAMQFAAGAVGAGREYRAGQDAQQRASLARYR